MGKETQVARGNTRHKEMKSDKLYGFSLNHCYILIYWS